MQLSKFLSIYSVAILFVLAALCSHKVAHATSQKPPKVSQPNEMTFTKEQAELGGQKIEIEIARSHEEQMRGLMFRKTLCEMCGMLFVYSDEFTRSFWMKNTFIPLSIGFFDKNKKLIDVQEMTPVVSEMQTDIPTYSSRGKAMYALEMNAKWFARHKVKLQSRLHWPK